MRILFLTDNFPPEVNAPATRTHFHCRTWVEAGAHVTVITCAPNFPRGEVFEGYRNRLYQTEEVDGIRVVRVWSYMAPNAGFIHRILDYASYAGAAVLAGLAEEFDVVVATSPQFLTALAGSVLARLKGRPWVFELRDLWPESIVATGAMRESFAIRALEHLELTLYRSADAIVPVTHSFQRQLASRGIEPGKVHVVTNGVDAADFAEVAVDRAGSRPGGCFRVGYLGTHGLAHGLDVALRAAAILSGEDVEFVLVGDGADKPRLVELADEMALTNVRLEDPIPRGRIPETLASFDVSLVPLRDSETFRSVIPSKIFEAAAAERPILLGVRGEARSILERYGAGLPFAPEDASQLAAAVLTIRDDPELYRQMQAGCAELSRDFDRHGLALSMLEHVRSAAQGRLMPVPASS